MQSASSRGVPLSPSGTQPPALEVISVRKAFSLGRQRVEILKGIDLRILAGELVALVGPSGSGKSTLLGILAGLDSPTSGRIVLDGLDISAMSERRLAAVRNAKIGMVFQAYNLIPTLSAQENVEVPLYAGRHSGRPARRARELLALVGLSHRLTNRPNQLSGGEQQRVAIARALATNPAIVIMDEPTGNLDRRTGDALLQLIRQMRETTSTTFVIATHDSAVAHAADRMLSLLDGSIEGEVRA